MITYNKFDITKVKVGDIVTTRVGQHIRLICLDSKCEYGSIIGLISDGGVERVYYWSKDGSFNGTSATTTSDFDLVLDFKRTNKLLYTLNPGDRVYTKNGRLAYITEIDKSSDKPIKGTIQKWGDAAKIYKWTADGKLDKHEDNYLDLKVKLEYNDFDVNAVNENSKIITELGHPIKIITFNALDDKSAPIVGYIDDFSEPKIYRWTLNGRCANNFDNHYWNLKFDITKFEK